MALSTAEPCRHTSNKNEQSPFRCFGDSGGSDGGGSDSGGSDSCDSDGDM